MVQSFSEFMTLQAKSDVIFRDSRTHHIRTLILYFNFLQ